MTIPSFDESKNRLKETLSWYRKPLLREVAQQMLRPRGRLPDKSIPEKIIVFLRNPPAIDRIMSELPTGCRKLLGLIAMSRQPIWERATLSQLSLLVEGESDLCCVQKLLEYGFAWPDFEQVHSPIGEFSDWLHRRATQSCRIWIPPPISARALLNETPVDDTVGKSIPGLRYEQTDGLEIPLRLGVLWQEVVQQPMRLTQQRELYKKDFDRIANSRLLQQADSPSARQIPQGGFLYLALGLKLGVLKESENAIVAGSYPDSWSKGLSRAITEIWAAYCSQTSWDCRSGWLGLPTVPNHRAALSLMVLAHVATLAEDSWISSGEIVNHFKEQKPGIWGFSRKDDIAEWIVSFLSGPAFLLGLVQIATGKSLIRPSPLGRNVLGLMEPPDQPEFQQTLLAQPNLEIVAYRQGLTPALVGELSLFADWKSLGAAATLQLKPESVYRGLEYGLHGTDMLRALQRHGVHETPPGVVGNITDWAEKRDRITLFPSATVMEFPTTEDLEQALSRGIAGVRLTDRMIAIPNEDSINYRFFMLTGTRDYGLPGAHCVEMAHDGVTLIVDPAHADLMLDVEIRRFADRVDSGSTNDDGNATLFRVTPESLQRAEAEGLNWSFIERWFMRRAGGPPSPAVRVLFPELSPARVQVNAMTVVETATPEQADGLMQWPTTCELIHKRLGPCAIVVAEEKLADFKKILAKVGMEVEVRS